MLIWYTSDFKYLCSGSQRSQCYDVKKVALGQNHSTMIITS